MSPIAFHIIWTTYGTWLPGDARGWIDKKKTGIQEPDPVKELEARDLAKADTYRPGVLR